MKILFLSPEVAPFSKTGGLGDVAAALPAALAALGHEVMVVTPFYGSVHHPEIEHLPQQLRLRFPFGWEIGSLHQLRLGPGHRVVFIGHPGYFHRDGVYQSGGFDFPDNPQRFSFFAVGALSAAQQLGFHPDIVHLNDWTCGLAAVALARGYQGTEIGGAKRVFTIHNLAYQGVFPKSLMTSLGLTWDLFTEGQLEFYDQLNFLKAGVAFSDAITTVSERYAWEIRTQEYGCMLEGLLQRRADSLHGILNGIDVEEWNPETDPHLPAHFSARDLRGKAACKKALLERFGFSSAGPEADWPVFGVVSRLVDQKGVDLLLGALPWMLQQPMRFVLLGSGEAHYENAFRDLSARFHDRARVWIGFENALSHLIEAGADFFLMPSRYEPCGLNQMYSLRYGTIPIVRATGGLDDTVIDVSQPEGNGLKFHDATWEAVAHNIGRALELYRSPEWRDLVRKRGMALDFSWDRSAEKYVALYRSLIGLEAEPRKRKVRATASH